MRMEQFEDAILPGVGSLKLLAGKSIDVYRRRVRRGRRFAEYIPVVLVRHSREGVIVRAWKSWCLRVRRSKSSGPIPLADQKRIGKTGKTGRKYLSKAMLDTLIRESPVSPAADRGSAKPPFEIKEN